MSKQGQPGALRESHRAGFPAPAYKKRVLRLRLSCIVINISVNKVTWADKLMLFEYLSHKRNF